MVGRLITKYQRESSSGCTFFSDEVAFDHTLVALKFLEPVFRQIFVIPKLLLHLLVVVVQFDQLVALLLDLSFRKGVRKTQFELELLLLSFDLLTFKLELANFSFVLSDLHVSLTQLRNLSLEALDHSVVCTDLLLGLSALLLELVNGHLDFGELLKVLRGQV